MDVSDNPPAKRNSANSGAVFGAVAALAGVATVLFGAPTIYWWVWAATTHRPRFFIWTAVIATGGLVPGAAVLGLCLVALRSSE